jgi:hypothetical protein
MESIACTDSKETLGLGATQPLHADSIQTSDRSVPDNEVRLRTPREGGLFLCTRDKKDWKALMVGI